ncbi:cytochrome c oxidase assembly protein [Nocardioides sp. zg-DK7169]|uniref:cytochrome c oxidase assembly protein n=1 Tax=Nocardioides sp. zg-DK7169 TaxID=2736600 RepID=UPI001557104B|nr:cytochrome c oxidase assembly protein [Nocardioides sp. zg-DK7169]NPC96488.1 bifunctional copper resistance protein CopD/cytochrome c oxidase assembly protein [Nocardioides sp. zg-DK7169]
MSPRVRMALLAVGGGLLALVAFLLLGGGAPEAPPAGLPDPGALSGWGVPVLGYVSIGLGVAVVGALLVPVLTAAGPRSELSGRAFRAVASVRWLAAAWLVVCLTEIVLTYSDLFAVPLRNVRPGTVWDFALQSDQGRVLLVQAAAALVLAVACRWVLAVRESAFLLVLAVLANLPGVLTGHSASSGSHDTAVIALALHVGPVTVWAGGLVALAWFLREPSEARSRAARRFSGLAACCLGLTLASGVVSALVRLDSPVDLFTTAYGAGVLAKTAALALLCVVALRARRTLVEREPSASGVRDLAPLVGLELVLMSVAAGLGVALGRTPPPVGEPFRTGAESLLGGPLPDPPSVGNLLLSFTPSGIGLAVVLLGTAGYIAGIVAVRRRGGRWHAGRTVSWFVGLLLVAYTTLGGLAVYSEVMFSAHMAAHMVLSMVAPIFLVVGAPVTLALRALPGADVPGGHGPRQWLSSVLRSRPARFLTHPLVAAVIFVGSLYAVYMTGVFEALMQNHLGHAFMELHFLIAGYLYFEVLVGDAPVPHRPSYLARLGLMLLVTPFHAFFAIALMSADTVVAGDYYAMLDRGFATDLAHDQYVGGSLTWALGEIPLLIVMVVLLFQWFRSDTRDADRHDRQSSRDADADLEAYNRMLAGLAEHDRTSR